MRTRTFIIAVAALSIVAGVAAAEQPEGRQYGTTATMSADVAACCQFVDADGRKRTCVSTEEYERLVSWYREQLAAEERRARLHEIVDAFEVDP